MIECGNLFANIAAQASEEEIAVLAEEAGVRIERIVSTGQASPPGFWYDQASTEWVVLLMGEAVLRFESEPEPRLLGPGDWLEIPAHARHRVEWTDTERPTVWLAVHFAA
ncbi:MAG TPA: cupin domain-containing protein [Methylocystis sp.]|nr:cupin domain-containing protein [Methylocystis sp.]